MTSSVRISVVRSFRWGVPGVCGASGSPSHRRSNHTSAVVKAIVLCCGDRGGGASGQFMGPFLNLALVCVFLPRIWRLVDAVVNLDAFR